MFGLSIHSDPEENVQTIMSPEEKEVLEEVVVQDEGAPSTAIVRPIQRKNVKSKEAVNLFFTEQFEISTQKYKS